MSRDLPNQTQGAAALRERIQVRVERVRQSRQRSALGVPELAGLLASGVMLLAVIFSYLYFLAPARARLAKDQVERESLQRRLRDFEQGVKRGTDTQTTIAEINQSLLDFETNRLASRGEGRMSLYDALNQLIRRNNLRNTSGPTYTPLEALGTEGQPGQIKTTRSGDARWQSVFPGIGVTVTVEGTYQDLRHFVRDVEASNQFIIIHAVELESVNSNNAPATTAMAQPGGEEGGAGVQAGSGAGTRSSLVSLRLDMAAYFRREGAQPAAQPATESR